MFSTPIELDIFSKNHLPHWRISFSEPWWVFLSIFGTILLKCSHFSFLKFFWNSHFYFFSLCFHLQTWDTFDKMESVPKKLRWKIFINKTLSDLAENLRAVRGPGGLTAHKISARSDNILLTKIFKSNLIFLERSHVFFSFVLKIEKLKVSQCIWN